MRLEYERFTFANGTFLVHPAHRCMGSHCPIHNPSLHAMVEEPMILRGSALIERQCKHGVGHPDPDSMSWLKDHGPEGCRDSWGVHGCDGCCSPSGNP